MRKDRVLVVCPSRDRPHSLGDMVASVRNTSHKADVAVYVDDDQKKEYPTDWPINVHLTYGPQVGPVASINELVNRFPGYAAYGAATDDSVFVTPEWDEWVLAKAAGFKAGIGVMAPYHESFIYLGASASMGRRHTRMDFPWATRRWIELVGWLACPACHSFYWDVVVELMGEMTQIAYAGPRDFEMQHAMAESANNDKIHHDAKEAILAVAFERKEIVRRLREAIDASGDDVDTPDVLGVPVGLPDREAPRAGT